MNMPAALLVTLSTFAQVPEINSGEKLLEHESWWGNFVLECCPAIEEGIRYLSKPRSAAYGDFVRSKYGKNRQDIVLVTIWNGSKLLDQIGKRRVNSNSDLSIDFVVSQVLQTSDAQVEIHKSLIDHRFSVDWAIQSKTDLCSRALALQQVFKELGSDVRIYSQEEERVVISISGSPAYSTVCRYQESEEGVYLYSGQNAQSVIAKYGTTTDNKLLFNVLASFTDTPVLAEDESMLPPVHFKFFVLESADLKNGDYETSEAQLTLTNILDNLAAQTGFNIHLRKQRVVIWHVTPASRS